MKRRSFLKNTAKGVVLPAMFGNMGVNALLPGASPLASLLSLAEDTDRVLVLVYLNGGNDGLNTIVPLDMLSNLSNARPNVMLPENSLLDVNGHDVGMHPSMGAFQDLFNEERLQIIQSVGYPEQDYSHFRSTDIWMSGSDSDQLITTGWAGRYLDQRFNGYPVGYPNDDVPDPLAIEIGYGASLLFQGPTTSMGMTISDPTWFYNLVDNVEDPLPDTNAADRLAHVRLIARQSQLYGQRVVEAAENVNTQSDYPEDNYLAEQLKIVARLIAGGMKTPLYMVNYGGFDTHDMQVDTNDTTQGSHAYLLEQVSQAIKSFVDDCEFLNIGDRVMGMTFSEFGRTIISNASTGTDHGAAAPLFLFGNKVAGGVTGENPVIPEQAMYFDDVEWQFDFRSIYASIFEQWFCLDPADISNILLQDFDTINVTSQDECLNVSTADQSGRSKDYVNVYPSPSSGPISVDFLSKGGMVDIAIVDQSGKRVMPLAHKNYPEGRFNVLSNISALPKGHYYLVMQQKNLRQTKPLIKV